MNYSFDILIMQMSFEPKHMFSALPLGWGQYGTDGGGWRSSSGDLTPSHGLWRGQTAQSPYLHGLYKAQGLGWGYSAQETIAQGCLAKLRKQREQSRQPRVRRGNGMGSSQAASLPCGRPWFLTYKWVPARPQPCPRGVVIRSEGGKCQGKENSPKCHCRQFLLSCSCQPLRLQATGGGAVSRGRAGKEWSHLGWRRRSSPQCQEFGELRIGSEARGGAGPVGA